MDGIKVSRKKDLEPLENKSLRRKRKNRFLTLGLIGITFVIVIISFFIRRVFIFNQAVVDIFTQHYSSNTLEEFMDNFTQYSLEVHIEDTSILLRLSKDEDGRLSGNLSLRSLGVTTSSYDLEVIGDYIHINNELQSQISISVLFFNQFDLSQYMITRAFYAMDQLYIVEGNYDKFLMHDYMMLLYDEIISLFEYFENNETYFLAIEHLTTTEFSKLVGRRFTFSFDERTGSESTSPRVRLIEAVDFPRRAN